MVHPLVEKATSDLLIGPDWAKNAEICALLNHDLRFTKSIVKGIKKRLRNKDPKVQLLALTLLETMMKDCGDIVHMHVAERNIPYRMTKIAKKRNADFRVKEKIVTLIDTWQQAFRGPRARYVQFYDAYLQLRRAGLAFPQNSQSLSSFSYHEGPLVPVNPYVEEDTEFPALSMTEIQNARGVMDILAEMLNALDPQKKEGLKQEAIMDLVHQCRTFKQRVIHLINSTLDTQLLDQGLALDNDLQCLLAKHEAIASGASAEGDKCKSTQALIDIVDTGDDQKLNERTTSNDGVCESSLDLLIPVASANTSIVSTTGDLKMDLLTSEDFTMPGADSALTLVLEGETLPNSPNQQGLSISGQDFSYNVVATLSHSQQAESASTSFQLPVAEGIQLAGFRDTTASNIDLPQEQQQLTFYRAEEAEALPPPPWEEPTNHMLPDGQFDSSAVLAANGQYAMLVENNQLVGMHASQTMGVYAHPIQNSGFPSYCTETHFVEQRMYAMSMNDVAAGNTSHFPAPMTFPPSGRPSKPEDHLFGDLVQMARSKSTQSQVPNSGKWAS